MIKYFLLAFCVVTGPFAMAENVAEIAKLNRDVMVPDQLVREIERWFIHEYKQRSKKGDEADHEILATVRRRLLDITVDFGPLRGKALSEATRVGLPTGGGIIDFADLLTGEVGGFTMKLGLDHPPKNGQLRVFYVSGAKRRTLVDGEYGAGCGKWMELTSWFRKESEPIKLYATEQRHLSVTTGIWVFAQLFEDQLWLGALTLKDSRYPALQCS